MKRLSIGFAVFLSLVLLVVVVQLLRVSNQLVNTRLSLAGIQRQLTTATSRLEELESQRSIAEKRLAQNRERVSELEALYRGSRRLFLELGLVDGVQSCSIPETSRTKIRVLEPSDGSIVADQVLIHLLVVEPLGCDATYWISVDGTPYVLVPRDPARPPVSAHNPQLGEPIPRNQWAQSCVSGVYDYILLKLEPGEHVVRVNGGCPQGTAVPRTIPAEVRFTVSG